MEKNIINIMEGQNTEEKKTETEVKKTQNEVELENALFPDLQEQFEEITKEEEYEIVVCARIDSRCCLAMTGIVPFPFERFNRSFFSVSRIRMNPLRKRSLCGTMTMMTH